MSEDNSYTCAECQGVFEKGWTDEEAQLEMKIDFPGMTMGKTAIICDDCYKKLGFERMAYV